jgi:hypothetical protein
VKLEEKKKIESTVCKPYLTPMVFNYRSYEGLLENIYVRHEDDSSDDSIFVLIRNDDEEKYSRVSARITILNNFVEELDVGSDFGLFKLKVPDSLMASYNLILQGKFSRLSQSYKKLIFESNNLMLGSSPDKDSQMYRILYRHPLYREALEEELGVKIDEEAELRDKPDIKGLECFKTDLII